MRIGGRLEKSCKHCKKDFTPKRTWQKHCSIKCKSNWWYHNTPHKKRDRADYQNKRYWQFHEKSLQYRKNYYFRLKATIFSHYGNKCVCCNESNMVFLSLDHKLNDGASHRRRLNGTNGGFSDVIYRDVRKQGYPDTYQILCFNCNRAKFVLGKCPHEEAMITK